MPARAGKKYLEVLQADGSYKPIWVKGMNFSAALPGKSPFEFPEDEGFYRQWLLTISEMNCNTIRVYTIFPPALYRALLQHNTAWPEKQLWLIQGVWAEAPPGSDYLDSSYFAELEEEISRAVDVVHGNASVAPRPRHAAGIYEADVSGWLLAYIVGREWEPQDIRGFHRLYPGITEHRGKHISAYGAQPFECWLARLCDYLVTYEEHAYRQQHPIAFSSWPTIDPLSHESEVFLVEKRPRLPFATPDDAPQLERTLNDVVNISCKSLTVEAGFAAGIFASYNVYPYYPGFIDLDTQYQQGRDRVGPSTYQGYLDALKDYYSDIPLLVSEYGMADGPFAVRQQSLGMHYGGLSQDEAAVAMRRMTHAIEDSGCAGGIVFSWMDEWFKATWPWSRMYHPLEETRFWYNPLDPAGSFGMLAIRPGSKGPLCTLTGNEEEWRAASRRYGTSVGNDVDISSVLVQHDEGYLYLRVELEHFADWNFEDHALYIGLDVLGSERGNTSWPFPLSLTSDRGLENLVVIQSGEARFLKTESFRFWEPQSATGLNEPPIAAATPYRLTAESNPRAWVEPVLQTNNRLVGRGGAVHKAQVWPVNPLSSGSLIPGPGYNEHAMWNATPASGCVELRLPWALCGFLAPHKRWVLQSTRSRKAGSEVSEGVGLAVVLADRWGREAAVWPGLRGSTVTTSRSGRYTWKTWKAEDIGYHSRLKPVYYEMREVFAEIQAPSITP
ncbi:hypothetical protein IIA79_01535 [bacterium]|nr:hypothetical protein [bacterium]